MAQAARMGFYREMVLPFLLDTATNTPAFNECRRRMLEGAHGRVLEIGFGTGLSAPHYPRAVERVVAIDSNRGNDGRAKKRIDAASVPFELRLADGQELPFDGASFDGVVTSLVLCSVADVARTLGEVRRVLKPGGRYFFFEHGLSDRPNLRTWQRRMNGMQMLVCGGCHLDRPIRSLIEEARFRFDTVADVSLKSAPWLASSATWGAASPN
jgi:ubiquinone/menaquinone biosynthesis C-methylase UbiE